MIQLTKLDKTFYSLFILSSILYTVIMLLGASVPLNYIIKVIPITCLLIITVANTEKTEKLLLSAALIFSGAGDIVLRTDIENLFVTGLVLFLIAHIFYLICFFNNFRFKRASIPLNIFIIAYAVFAGFLLKNTPEPFFIPVFIYLFIITVMALGAGFYSTGNRHKTSHLVYTGAALFMISDTLIAVNKFLFQFDYSNALIIFLYYLAQFLIINGIVLKNKFKSH
jgi:uncharacterized membrane protein YhhN